MTKTDSIVFDYIAFNKSPKPMANIKFQYTNKLPIKFISLIDSGADVCTSYVEVGKALDIDFLDYDKEKNVAYGVDGHGIDGYKTTINLWILEDGNPIITEVVWLDKPFLPDRNVPFLIGRKGIFDKFDILFQERIRRVIFMRKMIKLEH